MSKRNTKKQAKPRPKQVAKKALAPIYQRQMPLTAKLITALVIGLIGLFLYAPSHNYEFVYDDDAVIKDNRYVKSGTDGLGKIWTTTYFMGMNESINARAFRPIPLTTLALEVEFLDNKPDTAFEQKNWTPNPAIYHRTNLLFYGLTGFFLFFFLARMFKDYHYILPIIVTLLFVLHPIHVEVIANIKSRDTLLGFLNFAIAGWFLLKSVDSRKMNYLIPSLFFYFIALFSKEEVITFLAIIPAILYFFREMDWKKIVLYTAPFLGAVVIYLIIRTNIVGGLNAGVKLGILDNSLLATDGILERSASNLQVLGYYLLHTVFPHPLISDYSYSTLPNINWNTWQPYAALVTNLGLVAAMFHGLRKKALYAFGILYYFATVSIFTSLIITNVSAYNDRFLYSPVLGIMIVIGWGLYQLMTVKDEEGKFSLPIVSVLSKNILPIGIALILAALGIWKVSSHLPKWENRFVLFEHDMKLCPNNARLLKNHGGSLSRLALKELRGSEKRRELATEGVEVLTRALDIYERIPTGWIHLANCHVFLNENTKAEAAYRKALEFNPGNHYATVNLANVMYRLRKYQQAVNMLEALPKLNFTKGDYNLLSLAHEKAGNNGKAAEYRKLAK
ncbi:MAG: hypothetical protein ACI85O_000169 [Saprospiraceae bacterium]|jgi:hypothetical protein